MKCLVWHVLTMLHKRRPLIFMCGSTACMHTYDFSLIHLHFHFPSWIPQNRARRSGWSILFLLILSHSFWCLVTVAYRQPPVYITTICFLTLSALNWNISATREDDKLSRWHGTFYDYGTHRTIKRQPPQGYYTHLLERGGHTNRVWLQSGLWKRSPRKKKSKVAVTRIFFFLVDCIWLVSISITIFIFVEVRGTWSLVQGVAQVFFAC